MSALDDSCDVVISTLGYEFRDRGLLDLALAHPSFAHEKDASRGNERLEFLGDAVLDLVVAHVLFEVHPEWNEGDLTRTRAGLVNQRSLADRARELEFGRFIKLGRTEQRSGGAEKESILANCFEALVGAIFLDGGLAPVEDFVRRVFGTAVERGGDRQRRDPKTEFQEWIHARFRVTPRYRTVVDSGMDNDEERFTVEVTVDGDVWGQGVGRSKNFAAHNAAREALARDSAENG